MSPERELAQLVAHPWTEYRQGDKTYYGATCHVVYAAKVNRLAAICDLHRRTPLTKEILELNGFEKNGCDYEFVLDKYASYIIVEKDGTVEYEVYDNSYDTWVSPFNIRTVADFENLLDLLGIDKQIKLPKPKKQTNATQE